MNLYRQEQPGTPLFFESLDDGIMSFGYEDYDYDYDYDEYEAEETLALQDESEEEEEEESKEKLAIVSSLINKGDNNANKPLTAITKVATITTDTATTITTTNEATSSNCSICLHQYQDQSYLNYCYHTFCYSCISQWIKTIAKKTKKPYCPLCKNKIKYIIHNIDEAKGSFLKYYLENDYGERYGHGNNVNNNGGEFKITEKDKMMITKKRKKWIREISSNNNNLINETDLKRIKPFITRDLKVILSDMYDEIIEEHVQSILTMYYFNGSKTEKEVIDLLKPWLKGEKITQKFLSELNEFLNSDWNIEKWDELIEYD
ncbi:8757_t:CDS:2 [Entrophospora sp. SA101]|nr:8757_t:CDS:2 [Entrophospora sp. SA101]CAJ0909174.1 3915_t:CDS:2 [Entrophospora sp. SA101]